MDYIGVFKMDEAITIGMGVGNMNDTDRVAVKMKTDIFREGHDR